MTFFLTKLKAGLKVVRIQSRQEGPWERICKRKGLDPNGVFTIDYLTGGDPVFLCLREGRWAREYFIIADVQTSLEDWL